MDTSYKRYILIIAMAFMIVILGIITLNIKWTDENLQWDRPYKDRAEKLKIESSLDTNKYLVDNSPLKIFIGDNSKRDVRIKIKDYRIIINEASIKELRTNLYRGIKTTNGNLKEALINYYNEIISSFKR